MKEEIMSDIIQENTVSAKNQLPPSDTVFYLGEANAPLRILIVGNSITRHGRKPDIGWNHDFGMAASTAENDYVHLLERMVNGETSTALFMIRQASTWERGFTEPSILADFKAEHAFDPDILIFRLGENVPKDADPARYKTALEDFVRYICPNGRVIFTTTVWESESRSAPIRALAEKRREPCIDLSEIGRHDDLMAIGKFEHRGVSIHPGDKGMRYIAEKILAELKKLL
jgi:hypothetical protein